MKISKKIQTAALVGVMAVSVSVVNYSCSKSEPGLAGSSNGTSSAQKKSTVDKASRFANQISHIKIVADNGNVLAVNAKTGAFDFSQPHDGFAFSSNTGWEYVETADGGTVYISAGAFGSNASGGTVVAGNTSLEMNYTFCIAAGSSDNDFSFGPTNDSTGVSLVIGISGDLAALANGDGENLQDFFNGFAMYIVYDDELSGGYDIVNWIDDLDDSAADLKNKGFSWVVDFKTFHLYFSKSGQLTANGGSMDFQGKYLEFAPDAGASSDDLFDLGSNPDVTEVDGSGSMGCN